MKFVGYYNYTVIFTYAGLVAAVAGLHACLSGRPGVAITFLMLAGVLDMFDGKIARTRTKSTAAERMNGIQIDSLADLVSFGVLPAAIGYTVGMHRWWSVLITAVYVLAALIRLAYFNVDEISRQAGTDEARKVYYGLPVTSVALILPLVYSANKLCGDAFPAVYASVLVLISFLFLYKFKIAKLGMRGLLVCMAVGIAEFLLFLVLRLSNFA